MTRSRRDNIVGWLIIIGVVLGVWKALELALELVFRIAG